MEWLESILEFVDGMAVGKPLRDGLYLLMIISGFVLIKAWAIKKIFIDEVPPTKGKW